MNKYKPGDVVIVSTGQAGTVWMITHELVVLLRNGDIWYGQEYEARFPSSKKELKECPVDLEKWKRT